MALGVDVTAVFRQEEVYAQLWRSLLRWLVSRAGLLPGQDAMLQADRVSFETGQVATATMLVRPEKVNVVPKVRLDSGEGESREFIARPVGQQPGVYRFDFGQLEVGQYTATVTNVMTADARTSDVRTAFDVRQRSVEMLDLDARPDLMRRIAEASGGAVLESVDADRLAKQFREHLQRARPPQYQRESLWDRWWVMMATVGTWAATWLLRRRSGMV